MLRVMPSLRAAVALLRSPSGQGGPVAESVMTSLRRAALGAMAIWNLVLAVVSLSVELRLAAGILLGAHLAAAAIPAWMLRRRPTTGGLLFVLAVCHLVWILDYLAATSIDDAITLATCWLGNLLSLMGALVLPRPWRTLVPLLGSAVTVAVIVPASPVWTFDVASAFLVTALAVVTAVRAGVPALWRLADEADQNAVRLAQERRDQEVVRRASAEAAEDSRIVHDTVINTLGAIANGVVRSATTQVVRDRCARDFAVVTGLLAGRDRARRHLVDLGALPVPGSLQVNRPDDAELAAAQRRLGEEVADALVGAAEECVRNVGKHADAETVELRLQSKESSVTVRIVDDGIGLDGAYGLGIRESVIGRIEAVGGSVVIDSTPGRGTAVTLRVPAAFAVEDDGPNEAGAELASDARLMARQLIRRACWLMSTGIVLVGVAIELANRPGELTWTYAMLAIVASMLLLAFAATRGRNAAPLGVQVALALCLPLAFVAAIAGVDFGRTDVLYFQAIGFAPLLIILLSVGRERLALGAGALLVAVAVSLAVVLGQESSGYAAVVMVAALPGIGLAVGWALFERLAARIVAEAERARLLVAQAALDAAAQREVTVARRRWGTAGLERSAELLGGIADGTLDVADAEVRRACAIEERYLRQLLLLSPTAYRVSAWFAQALALARSREVRFAVRAGDLDAPDAQVAAMIGRVVLGAVEAASAGAEITVGWFPTQDGPRLVLVAPATASAAEPFDWEGAALPPLWTVERSVLGERAVIELALMSPNRVAMAG